MRLGFRTQSSPHQQRFKSTYPMQDVFKSPGEAFGVPPCLNGKEIRGVDALMQAENLPCRCPLLNWLWRLLHSGKLP
jgi:hypothetical protein